MTIPCTLGLFISGKTEVNGSSVMSPPCGSVSMVNQTKPMYQPTMILISYPNSQKAHVAMAATARLSRVPSRPMVIV